jgi:hypothetical protein
MYFYEKIINELNYMNKVKDNPNNDLGVSSKQVDEILETNKPLRDAVLIDVTNVKEYCKNLGENFTEFHSHVMKTHIMAPPFNNVYLEIDDKLTDLYYAINGDYDTEFIDAIGKIDLRVGIHLLYKEIYIEDYSNDKLLYNFFEKYDIKWVLCINVYMTIIRDPNSNNKIESDVFVFSLLSPITSTGKMNYNEGFSDESKVTEYDKIELDHFTKSFQKDFPVSQTLLNSRKISASPPHIAKTFVGIIKDFVTKRASDQMIRVILLLAYISTTFMHCKNVKLIEIDPSDELSNTKKKKMLRHGETLPRKYNVIYVEPMRQKNKKINNNGIKSNSKTESSSYSICKGHFKTYTEEKPLFGRVVGTFWWDSHIRGTLEMDIKPKVYKIKLD